MTTAPSAPSVAPRRRRLTVLPAGEGECAPAQLASNRASGALRDPGTAGANHAIGALLAVCGLCGGAGASTLAFLVALDNARSRGRPVLVCDTGGPSGGLSAISGVRCPASLEQLAALVQAGLPTGPMFTTTDHALRVLAATPRFDGDPCPSDGVQLLLEQARAAHELTIVDAGTLARHADRLALSSATHVAWVLPATRPAVHHAAHVLDALDAPPGIREAIVARRADQQSHGVLRELRRLAYARRATLILLPAIQDCLPDRVEDALGLADVALQAITGWLDR